MARTDDPQLAAFHRLITDAHHGGQAKVDVLVALSQRLVHLVPWPQGIDGFRTLVNSEGVAALPIFTHRDALEEAARRYGWLDAHGNAPAQELGARAALIRGFVTMCVRRRPAPCCARCARRRRVRLARRRLIYSPEPVK